MSGEPVNNPPAMACPVNGADGGTGHIHDSTGRRCLKCGQRIPGVRTGSGTVEERSNLKVRPGRLTASTRTGHPHHHIREPGVDDVAGWPEGESPWG